MAIGHSNHKLNHESEEARTGGNIKFFVPYDDIDSKTLYIFFIVNII